MTRRRTFPVVETLLVIFAVASTALYYIPQLKRSEYFAREPSQELVPLLAYGPAKHSENYEEWIIRDFFADKRDGVFLDVGAHHYQEASNTYFLESQRGWSGIAVEPQTEFAADYARHRPHTRFVPMFASDVVGAEVSLFVPRENKLIASASESFPAGRGFLGIEQKVPTTTLNDLLEQAGIMRVDLLSMDIELHEPVALKGFDIARYQPALVCIEGHPQVRQQILDYFQAHDYVLVGKYLRVDVDNLYFVPVRTHGS